jgi:hypothetical protein
MNATTPCPPRKHDYEFKGNKKFTSMTMSARGTSVRMSVNAVYECKTCGKVRRGPVKRGAAGDSLI